MHLCPKCKTVKPTAAFALRNGGKYISFPCRPCFNAHRKRVPESRERRRARDVLYVAKNAEKVRAYRTAWRRRNLTLSVAYSLKWAAKNRAAAQSASNRRRAAKLQRTPPWLSEDDHWVMDQAYELAQLRQQVVGGSWHVDHYTPLQGKTVSGLHVPWNLKVITSAENCRKGNSFIDWELQ